jgi:3'-5' exoribonuclease
VRITTAASEALLKRIFADEELCERLRRIPAATRHHHNYQGGYLEHTLGVMRLALNVAAHYPQVDRDLLLAGAFLHDIGKVEAYTLRSGLPEMTDQGKLLGHVYLGVRRVEKLVDGLSGFPEDLRYRLLHLIGSHHGEREFGVLEVPKTPEAILLHYLDNIDAKMKAALTATEQANGRTWTAPVASLGQERLYVGVPAEEEPPHPSEAGGAPAPGTPLTLFNADEMEV